MPLTPEQQALKQVALAASNLRDTFQPFVTHRGDLAVKTFSLTLEEIAAVSNYYDAANPAAILALLAQLEGCNEDYGSAVDSVAQLQDEVFEVRAQLEAAQEALSEPEECRTCKGGDNCRFPLCRDADEQQKIAEEVTAEIIGAPSVHVFARTKEAALQAPADQAQELGTGYEGMLMPSPPGSAGSGEQGAFEAHIANKYPNMSLEFWTRLDGVIVYKDAMVQGRWAGWTARALQPVQPDTDKLLAIIASAYQIAGAHDAPANILDVLADPEAATVEQVEAMLPYQVGLAVADGRLQKMREALETYYRALTIKQPSAAQPAAIYAIEQAMGMSWMGWLASLPVGAAPAGPDERKE